MKAIMAIEPGAHGRLALVDAPDPAPQPGEVVVEVAAVGINHADLSLVKGLFGPSPRIPGIDVAGRIAALADGVTGLRVGDRVLLNPAVTCGRCDYCRTGNDGTCRQRRALGQLLDGGYAQYVAIPAVNVLPLADEVSFEIAATIPANFFTAWQMLFLRGSLQPGETVLISGAAGGVGSAALQIARLAGARTIAAVGSEAKAAAVRGWGADVVIDYTRSNDLAQAVLAATAGEGADIIIDTVGVDLWPDFIRALRAGGRLVSCGFVAGRRLDIDIVDIIARQAQIFGCGGSGSKPVAARVTALVNQGRLAGHIDRILPLAEAAEAHRLVADRQVIGKLLLAPEPPPR
jgi:NADPH:quinone reductase-like Zn-dependent oxidoreductase